MISLFISFQKTVAAVVAAVLLLAEALKKSKKRRRKRKKKWTWVEAWTCSAERRLVAATIKQYRKQISNSLFYNRKTSLLDLHFVSFFKL
jgi:hypothetical protein